MVLLHSVIAQAISSTADFGNVETAKFEASVAWGGDDGFDSLAASGVFSVTEIKVSLHG